MTGRIVVLASGSGSNLQGILDACDAGRIGGEVVGVVCDKTNAYALERARRHGVHAVCMTLKENRHAGGTRQDFDACLADVVASFLPDLIVLAGFMHILSPSFLDRFDSSCVVNLHPSLLPANPRDDHVVLPDGRISPVFRGHDAVAQALAAGVRWTGTSVHLVTADVDRGPVLGQVAVEIREGDTVETLQARIQQSERRLLPSVIGELLRARGFAAESAEVATPAP